MGERIGEALRTRLSTEERRAQLLRIGAELFAKRPYEEVWIEEVAELAGVSCGLLYHYFPSKRAFFLAIVEEQSGRLLKASTPDAALPPIEQLKAGLEIYIGYAERFPEGFRMAQHIAVTDQDLGQIHRARVLAHRDRILDGLRNLMTVDEDTGIAVIAWVAFVSTAIAEWLDNPGISREQLRDLCARTFWAAVDVPGAANSRLAQDAAQHGDDYS
jgi:AcrR family transcriptional regulator